MIARADDDPGLGADPLQIGENDGDLRLELDARADIEVVTGDDDDVEGVGAAQHPIKLLEGVMQVGNEEAPHHSTVLFN